VFLTICFFAAMFVVNATASENV